MKRNYKFIVLVLLPAIIVATAGIVLLSCDSNKENYSQTETKRLPSDENIVIDTIDDYIRLKFYLLNKDNVPTNSFKQGENFSFCLELENQQEDSNLRLVDDIYQLIDDGFGRVISQAQDTVGNPFVKVICTEEFRTYPFFGENKQCKIIIPWTDRSRFFSSAGFCFDISPQPALAKGIYYTEFTHIFSFYVPPKQNEDWSWINTNSINFKIIFEII
jgi:hypothetical protein